MERAELGESSGAMKFSKPKRNCEGFRGERNKNKLASRRDRRR